MMDTTKNLIVKGLPLHVDDNALKAIFQPFGNVLSARVMRDLRTGISRGFGFVLFATTTDAIGALSATVLVPAQPDTTEATQRLLVMEAHHTGKNVMVATTKLYIHNVPPTTTEQAIVEFFSRYGSVRRCVIRRFASPRSNSIAFVQFSTAEEAASALEAHNTTPFADASGPILCKLAETPQMRAQRQSKKLTHGDLNDPGENPLGGDVGEAGLMSLSSNSSEVSSFSSSRSESGSEHDSMHSFPSGNAHKAVNGVPVVMPACNVPSFAHTVPQLPNVPQLPGMQPQLCFSQMPYPSSFMVPQAPFVMQPNALYNQAVPANYPQIMQQMMPVQAVQVQAGQHAVQMVPSPCGWVSPTLAPSGAPQQQYVVLLPTAQQGR